ncbi:hypothetical protein V1522DRAFT_398421, partial [Lipomyces starkeyi]
MTIYRTLDHPTHGRPNKKRVRTEDIGIARKRVTCSRCHKQLGHNASTCREPL